MVHVVNGDMSNSLVALGAGPDAHAGKLRLILPNGEEFIVDSGSVTVGDLGIRCGLPDGRGLLIHTSGAVFLDCFQDDEEKGSKKH